MTDERWVTLRESTWFRKEQDEVTEYVEKLRGLLRLVADDLRMGDGNMGSHTARAARELLSGASRRAG